MRGEPQRKAARRSAVMLVDDDPLTRRTMGAQLGRVGYAVATFASAEDALEALRVCLAAELPEVVVTDLRLPGMDGIALLSEVRDRWPGIDVVLMTAYASVATAVEALRAGAADYLIKPFRFVELQHRLERLATLREVRGEVSSLRAVLGGGVGEIPFVAHSPQMLEVLHKIETIARSNAPVLILGETGTGKGVCARAIHQASPRARKPFVVVSCGALIPSLVESTLFGHERGAFTGATGRKAGVFELANRGTLLLDDLDDLPLAQQVKLLRVLQEGRIRPLGASAEYEVDVRVLATTKVDLEARVAQGSFRADLYHRLRTIDLEIPPLRSRRDDILPLFEGFLERACREQGRRVPEVDAAVRARLLAHAWPGNVRELAHVAERIAVLSEGDRVDLGDLPPAVVSAGAATPSPVATLDLEGVERLDLHGFLREIEARVVRWALDACGGSQSEAARRLGIPRTTLQARLKRLGITPGEPRDGAPASADRAGGVPRSRQP